MQKDILRYEDIREKILSGLEKITGPVAQTLGPKGSNVIFENNAGDQFVTNDGVTIAKNISVKDPVENAVIEIVKGSALRTNQEAGDGTSTTILLASILIKEGMKMIENGENRMDLRKQFIDFANKTTEKLKKNAIKITGEDDIRFIANISSNNDKTIADDVVRIIRTAGEDGQVLIEGGFSQDTEIIEDAGFVMPFGMLSDKFAMQGMGGVTTQLKDVPVLVTDKRLYYAQEAETILKTCLNNGYQEVVVVAKDFIGEALPFFIANHERGTIKVLLVKDKLPQENLDMLNDLAIYLGGDIVSDKKGKLVDNLTLDDFLFSPKVFSDLQKTIILRDKKDANAQLSVHIEDLKKEKKKIGNKQDGNYKNLEKRIARLTNGMVTIKVGGNTSMEVSEKVYRYEDAINAARSAMRNGYHVGGGVTLNHVVKSIKWPEKYRRLFNAVGSANIEQIAENTGLIPQMVLEDVNIQGSDNHHFGFNAKKENYGNLLEEGVIDPAEVISLSVRNAVSIANVILTSRYFILNRIEDYEQSKT